MRESEFSGELASLIDAIHEQATVEYGEPDAELIEQHAEKALKLAEAERELVQELWSHTSHMTRQQAAECDDEEYRDWAARLCELADEIGLKD